MTRIKLIFILFLTLFFNAVSGQSESDSFRISLGYPVYSQYLQNGLAINPAYAGTRGALSGFLSLRKQWMGIKGAPVMQSVSLHTPMKDEKVGLGIMAQFMQYSFTRTTSIYASYSYRVGVWKGKLSLGIKAGADMSNTIYPNGNFLTNPGDPVFINDRPYVLPNFGVGVYYYDSKYFAGLSVPALLGYERTSSGNVELNNSISTYDFVFTGGGIFSLSDRLKFKPSFLLDYSMQSTGRLKRLDINGNFILNDLIWMGASWRTSEQVLVGIVQMQVNQQLMIGLSYDYPAGRMNSFSKGSTEFGLRYDFGTKISAANPRYF
jgi:type IX secretion system PorP/SprF family membrane protein